MDNQWINDHRLIDLRRTSVLDADVRAQIRDGTMRRLTAEMAVPAEWYDNQTPWRRAHIRAVAVGLTIDAGVVSGPAAARLWGIELLSIEEQVDVQMPGGTHPGAKSTWTAGARYRSTLLPSGQYADHDGIRITSKIRTLADVTRFNGLVEGVVAFDSARRQWPGKSTETLLADVGELGRMRGIARVREAVRLSVPNSGSVWESKARMILHQYGGEAVTSLEVQVEFIDEESGQSYFVDILVNGWVILEIDGRGKYRGEHGIPTETVVIDEREREKALQNLGPVVIRAAPGDLEVTEGSCVMLRRVLDVIDNHTPPRHVPRVHEPEAA